MIASTVRKDLPLRIKLTLWQVVVLAAVQIALLLAVVLAVRERDVLEEIEYVLFLGAPFGLLAGGVAAWVIAGRVVRPLVELAQSAGQVSPMNLGARVRVCGSEEELVRLDRELNRALERMEKGFRAQEQFIGNVAHELETPIAVMMTELQVLERSGAPAPAYREFARSAEDELRRLSALVGSFLKLARFRSGIEGLRLQNVPVQDVVLEAVQHCTSLARLHGVRLAPTVAGGEDYEEEAEVAGDPELLRTMVDNVVRNAIQFSPAGASVEVLAASGAEEVEFVVSDHGPGLPADYLERVFERFTQVPGGSDRGRGSGLGLAIVRDIAELHGGRVAARNNPEGGCSITVTLPLRRPRARSASTIAHD